MSPKLQAVKDAPAVRPYRPANGTEGIEFVAMWCARCQCEPEDIEAQDGCPILTRTYALKVEDADYPPEWITGPDGPRCTAFLERTEAAHVADPYAVAKARERYGALPRDPVTGRPVIA